MHFCLKFKFDPICLIIILNFLNKVSRLLQFLSIRIILIKTFNIDGSFDTFDLYLISNYCL